MGLNITCDVENCDAVAPLDGHRELPPAWRSVSWTDRVEIAAREPDMVALPAAAVGYLRAVASVMQQDQPRATHRYIARRATICPAHAMPTLRAADAVDTGFDGGFLAAELPSD